MVKIKTLLSVCMLSCLVGVNATQAGQSASSRPADIEALIARCLEDAQSAAAHVDYEWLRADAFEVLADVQRQAGNVTSAKTSLAEARKAIDIEQPGVTRYEGFMRLAEEQLQFGDLPAAKMMIGIAAREAEAMSDIHLRARVFPGLALRQYKYGDAAGAQATWQLTRQAIAQDGPWQPSDFSDLAHSLAAAGKIDEARAIAGKTKDDFEAGQIWSAIASGQVDAGDITGAIHSLACLPSGVSWLGSKPGAKIAETLAGAGNVKGAEAAMRFIVDDMDWGDALIAIVRAKLKTGAIDGAKAAADGISEEAKQAIALSFIAPAQMKAGQENAARRTLAEAAKAAASVEPWFGHGTALCALARAQAAVGYAYVSFASFALAQLDAAKGDPSDYRDDNLWLLQQSIVEAALRTGDINGAKSIVASLNFDTVDAHRSQAYRMIAAAMSKSGNADDVRSWIKSLASDLDRTYAFIGAAEGLLSP